MEGNGQGSYLVEKYNLMVNYMTISTCNCQIPFITLETTTSLSDMDRLL